MNFPANRAELEARQVARLLCKLNGGRHSEAIESFFKHNKLFNRPKDAILICETCGAGWPGKGNNPAEARYEIINDRYVWPVP